MKIGKIRINMIENASYYDRENAFANVGESIQAVTMEAIFDQIGVLREDIIKIDQCKIKKYRGEPIVFPLRIPLSKENVDTFLPLDESVTPIFISLHLHDDIFENRDDLVAYFQRFAPIGCRDELTCSYFRKHQIESYIMGCYTLCLPQRDPQISGDKVFLVDVSQELENYLPHELKEEAIWLSHAVPFQVYPVTHSEDERLEKVAREYLDRYKNRAKLVVTSRLHAAAPCMAMGIPVILASNNIDFRYAWVDKFLKLYQIDDYPDINWNPQIQETQFVRNILLDFFRKSIKFKRPDRECLKILDSFYRERNKTEYYKCFRQRLYQLKQYYEETDSFVYAIWGAGCHALFAHELMKDIFPNAKLSVVIDKYKKGELFGVPIIVGDQLRQHPVDHVCITTNPGLEEALDMCEQLRKEKGELTYTIITSQQKS